MLYLALGILLIAIVVFLFPIVGSHLTETAWPKKVLVVLAGFGTCIAGLSLITRGLDGMFILGINKSVFQVIIVASTVLATLFAHWLVRTICRAIYDAGFNSAESAYRITIDDLRKDVMKLHQFLAEKGIELPENFYEHDDENNEVNDE